MTTTTTTTTTRRHFLHYHRHIIRRRLYLAFLVGIIFFFWIVLVNLQISLETTTTTTLSNLPPPPLFHGFRTSRSFVVVSSTPMIENPPKSHSFQHVSEEENDDDDDAVKGYKRQLKNRFEWNRSQVLENGGAFVHLGKTGGSSLSILLRNGCHSWLQHPCRIIPAQQETRVSQLVSSYYHVADFGLLPRSHHDFYFLTLRDPFDRTISAFVYEHYLNVRARNETHLINPRIRRDFQSACQKCFPTLEQFVAWLNPPEDSNNFYYPFKKNQVVATSCSDLARAIFHGRVRSWNHLYFNYQRIHHLIPHIDNQVILVTRLEHLWNDWDAANQFLTTTTNITKQQEQQQEQQQQHETHKKKKKKKKQQQQQQQHHVRNMAEVPLVVTRQLSPKGRQILCGALQPEYHVYFWFLSRARNLGKSDLLQSMVLAKQHCQQLTFDFQALHRPFS